MEIIIVRNKKEMAKKAALIIFDVIKTKPNAVLELATGKTMIPVYKELIKLYKGKKIDFSQVSTFNLDEFAHIPFNNPKSYHYYMSKNLFNKVNIKKYNTHFPTAKGKEYENEIAKSGGIDLSLLGIGENGHIAFNEPGSSFKSKTREVKIPRDVYTVGIGTIMKAKKIVLLASGVRKANAIHDTIKGLITEKLPASILRKHKNAILIVDKKAAKRL